MSDYKLDDTTKETINTDEAMKEGFATRLKDVEDKAERYRLALEKCNNLIYSGVSAFTLQHTIREALKQ